jgi:hypothetical protein
MTSSLSRASPARGTHARKPALASKPELKRSATGAGGAEGPRGEGLERCVSRVVGEQVGTA